MVFIQELSLARTRRRSCISLVDTLNSLIVNRFVCYDKKKKKTDYDKSLAEG